MHRYGMKSLTVALAMIVALFLVAVSIWSVGREPDTQGSVEPDPTIVSVAKGELEALRSPEPQSNLSDSAAEKQVEPSTHTSVQIPIRRTKQDFEEQYRGYTPEQLMEARQQLFSKVNEMKRVAFSARWKEGLYELVPPKEPGVPAETAWSDELIHSMRVPKVPSGGVDGGERFVDTLTREDYPEIYDVNDELMWLILATTEEQAG